MTNPAPDGAIRALHGARVLAGGNDGDRDLVQNAAAAMSAKHGDVARRLLEEHRRRFPRGRHAGERERLLVSLRGGAR